MRMTSRFAVSLFVIFSLLALAGTQAILAADQDNNPPGPQGGPGTNWENRPGPQGGPGAGPDTLKEKAVVDKPWERAADANKDGVVDKTEVQQWRQQHSERVQERARVNTEWEKAADTNKDGVVDKVEIDQWKQGRPDMDNNPPGPQGGAGTNWENPPGPQGGPGASPDNLPEKAAVNRPWERAADANKDGVVDKTEVQQWRQNRPDNDNNPPGPQGGPGTNWENRPGPQGGPGAGPDRMMQRDMDNNPPGPRGGAGTNWENKPGPQGGPGASPNRRPAGGGQRGGNRRQ